MTNRFPEYFKEYKKERRKKGETQADIAKRWGIDAATMSRYANGHVNGIPFDLLAKICRDMRVTPNDILWDTEGVAE